MTSATGAGRRTPLFGVLLLIAGIAATAVWVGVVGVAHLQPVHAPFRLPWWALVPAFSIAEIFVINLDRGRDTHSFSMVEIPMVAGLYLVTPLGLVAARILGAVLVLVAYRRQPPLKLAFNLSLFALETTVGITLFHAIGGANASVRPGSWPAPLAACMVVNLVGVMGVTLVIAATSSEVQLASLKQMLFETALLGPIANTSIAMCVMVMLWYEPAAALLMALVAAIVVLAYRAYVALTKRYANLTKLYDFNQRAQAPDPNQAVPAMLLAVRDVMSVELAALILVHADGTRSVHTSVADDAAALADAFEHAEADAVAALMDLVTANAGALFVRSSGAPAAAQDMLDRMGWRDCLAVASETESESGTRGFVIVANRVNALASFERADLALFSALAGHAEVILANARLVDRLRHDALHDSLTGLSNRVGFNQRVDDAIAHRRPGEKICVLLMDLDRFKQVNDTLGHDLGDRLLAEVGRRLTATLDHTATVARLGGDEFAVLLPPCADASDAIATASLVDHTLQRGFRLGDMEVDAPAAIGIAMCPDHGEDATTLLQRADVAMYTAKDSAQIETYSPERDRNTRQRLELFAELRVAIASGQLEVWYQPQADARTGAVTAVEALVRWRHPVRGLVPPDAFIPVAEQSGLIGPLTDYVLDQVARQHRLWARSGMPLEIGVNVSMRNLQERGFADRVSRILEERGVAPDALLVEITESSIMADQHRTMESVDALAALGIGISVDDFGTGYSSLSHLRELPVREMKIDKSFVMRMDSDEGDATIVHAVIDLGRRLGLTIVAEGVETAAAWEQLAAWGCDRIQGYYLAKPMPPDVATPWLAERVLAERDVAAGV
ncbi:MAG TPA: EAL domain-containing protein [Acidimicrobiia bacterium]